MGPLSWWQRGGVAPNAAVDTLARARPHGPIPVGRARPSVWFARAHRIGDSRSGHRTRGAPDMNGFLIAFAVSFGVVFVAELGDKSQLMALTFATRYRALPVLIGITIATAVVHAVSVAVGYGLGAALPTGWIALVAAVAFLGFGAWTLRGDTLTDDEQSKAERSTGSAVVAADALAIVVGRQLGRHLPERAIKFGASGLFFIFGVWLLVDALAQINGVSPTEALARALDHHLAGWIALGLGLVAMLLGVFG